MPSTQQVQDLRSPSAISAPQHAQEVRASRHLTAVSSFPLQLVLQALASTAAVLTYLLGITRAHLVVAVLEGTSSIHHKRTFILHRYHLGMGMVGEVGVTWDRHRRARHRFRLAGGMGLGCCRS